MASQNINIFSAEPGMAGIDAPPPLSLSAQIMSEEQWESVAVSVESLLSDAKRMQTQCRERSEQLSMAATQLRVESAALREQCEASQLDMARIRRQLDELMDTKAAFEARERQARKLSKHLWGGGERDAKSFTEENTHNSVLTLSSFV